MENKVKVGEKFHIDGDTVEVRAVKDGMVVGVSSRNTVVVINKERLLEEGERAE